MRKMRGILDPFSLGFLLMFIGGTTAYVVHADDEQLSAEAENRNEQTKSASINTFEDS